MNCDVLTTLKLYLGVPMITWGFWGILKNRSDCRGWNDGSCFSCSLQVGNATTELEVARILGCYCFCAGEVGSVCWLLRPTLILLSLSFLLVDC
jgi:hypothetical protein